MTCLVLLAACGTETHVTSTGGSKTQSPAPLPSTSPTPSINPCQKGLPWISLGFRDYLLEVGGPSNWLEGYTLHYDAQAKVVYASGNRQQRWFQIHRFESANAWQPLYQRIVITPPTPNGYGAFLEISSAFNEAAGLLYFSLIESASELTAAGEVTDLLFPGGKEPAQWMRFDPVQQRIYVAHPNGVESRPADVATWQAEADPTDLDGFAPTGLAVYRNATNLLLLCAITSDAVSCRPGAGAWQKIPVLDLSLAGAAIGNLQFDSASNRLYALANGKVIASEGLNGWTIWVDSLATSVDSIQAVPGQGLYLLADRQIWLFDDSGDGTIIVTLPSSFYGAHHLTVFPEASFGLVFIDEDGCPTDDATCPSSDVYAVCLE